MWVYSISYLVNHSIEKEWLDWMKEVHIKEFIDTKYFIKSQFSKVHHETSSQDSTNYNLLLFVKDKQSLDKYYKQFDLLLNQKTWVLFRDQIMIFKTELEILDEE